MIALRKSLFIFAVAAVGFAVAGLTLATAPTGAASEDPQPSVGFEIKEYGTYYPDAAFPHVYLYREIRFPSATAAEKPKVTTGETRVVIRRSEEEEDSFSVPQARQLSEGFKLAVGRTIALAGRDEAEITVTAACHSARRFSWTLRVTEDGPLDLRRIVSGLDSAARDAEEFRALAPVLRPADR